MRLATSYGLMLGACVFFVMTGPHQPFEFFVALALLAIHLKVPLT
jgi:hypothetical protein